MALDAEIRIPDTTLQDNDFKDGEILRGSDVNKIVSVLKAGVNENYKDLKESDAMSNEHILDEVRHITGQERDRWNNTYTKEELYTKEEVYNKSEVYNKNETYPKENLYTKEETYSKSETYPKESLYTKSEVYSKSETYPKESLYTKNDVYAKEEVYTKGETYSKNDVYTKDNVYTKSEVDQQINDRITAIGSADMQKAVYDTNSNGIVDNSERLGGQLPSYYATKSEVDTKLGDKADKTDVSKLQTDVSELQDKSYEIYNDESTLQTNGSLIRNMVIFGKSEQKSYSGKNLLNKDSLQNYKSLGVADGIIRDTSYQYCVSDYIEVKQGNKITITNDCGNWAKACLYDVNKNFIICPYNKSADVKTYTITVNQNGYIVFAFDVLKENVGNSMVEIGSVATEYEPYVGGIPSPNPSYPQEINSVVNPKVTVCGKNLFNKDNCIDGVYIDSDGTMTSYNDYSVSDYIPIKKNTKYCFMSFDGQAIASGSYINYYDENKNLLSTVKQPQASKFEIVTPSNVKYLKFTIINTRYNFVVVSENDYSNTYEPYKGQVATLPYTLNAIPVSEGGNVTINGQQYISDYVDIENKKLVRNVGNIILDGSYTYKTDSNSNGKYYYSSSSGSSTINMKENSTLLCDKAINATHMNELHKGTILSTSVIVIGNDNEVIKSADAFKEWIGNNPYTVYYELATPTETDLTDEEVAQFKALQTYVPTSNIIASSDVLAPKVEFNYNFSKGIDDLYRSDIDIKSDVSTLQSDTYFNVGETLTIPNSCNVQGIITASAKTLFFILPLQKSLKNISSVTLNSITGVIRVNPYFTLSGTTLNIVGGNYASGTTSTGVDLLTFASSHTVVINKEVGCLVLSFKKQDGWGCSTNTNCSVEIKNVSITFN